MRKVLLLLSESIDPVNQPSERTLCRLERGLRHWQKGEHELIIVCGGIFKPKSVQTIAAGIVMQQWLMNNGVPEEKIIVESLSLDTYENIRFADMLLKYAGYTPNEIELTIITQWQHACRAAWTAKSYGYHTNIFPTEYNLSAKEMLVEYCYMGIHYIDRKGKGLFFILALLNRCWRHWHTFRA